MAAPAITLPSGQVLISKGASVLGIVPIDKPVLQFGSVAAVNDLSDKSSVGDSVMYDTRYASEFLYGSTIYVIIDEKYISGVETDLP